MSKTKTGVYVTGWCGGLEVDKDHARCPHQTTQQGLVCGCKCHGK